MKKSEINFPYPMLNNYCDDYNEDCTVNLFVTPGEDTASDFVFDVEMNVNCPGMEKMIASGELKCVVKAYSSKASYREVFDVVANGSSSVSIPKSCVSEKIEITGYILSLIDSNNFSLDEHNKDFFTGIMFKIHPGNILAESDPLTVFIDETELQKQLSSIVKIDLVSDINQLNVKYDSDDGLIHIQMPKEEYNSYAALSEKYRRYGITRFLQCAIVLPALSEAVAILRMEQIFVESDEEYESNYLNTVWADTILNALEIKGIDLSDELFSSYSIANELLGFVTADAVGDLYSKAKEMYNNEETTRIGGVD